MSLLLEALKKAALEKQSRSESGSRPGTDVTAQTNEDSLIDTLQQADEIEPIPETATTDIDAQSDASAAEDLGFDFEQHSLDEDLTTEISDTDLEEELTFEPEFDEEHAANDDADAPEETEQALVVTVADAVEHEPVEEEADTLVDEAEIAAGLKRIEQEHLLAQQRIRDEERLEAERNRIARAAEEERSRNEEAEAKRAADIAAQERRRQASQNKDALDQLIISGKQIRKKAQRRSAFLYTLLVLTALGGLSAYYVFLIANTGKSELQASPIVQPNPDIADVVALIQAKPGETSGDANRLNPDTTTTLSDRGSAVSSVNTQASTQDSNDSVDENTTALEGQVGALEDSRPPTANANVSANSGANETQPTVTASNKLIARRLDPPPSATAYLQPLIRSANGSPQTENLAERVIIHHKAQPRPSNDLIQQAYQALQANRLEQADRLYRSVLQQEPTQRDALLGAAATATALGFFDQAITHYQTRLQAAPNDTYARAGLLGLASSANSRDQVQKEVNSLLRENPDSAQLHFIKGVGLASGQQWQAAQSAFYEAYSRDNINPDYAFNLAVSLDHLSQPVLARVYYERAVELSGTRKIHFERTEAERRIAELRLE